jgi:hypothetical protein
MAKRGDKFRVNWPDKSVHGKLVTFMVDADQDHYMVKFPDAQIHCIARKNLVEIIDATPSWYSLLTISIHLVQQLDDPKALSNGRKNLIDMAKAADLAVKQQSDIRALMVTLQILLEVLGNHVRKHEVIDGVRLSIKEWQNSRKPHECADPGDDYCEVCAKKM